MESVAEKDGETMACSAHVLCQSEVRTRYESKSNQSHIKNQEPEQYNPENVPGTFATVIQIQTVAHTY